MNINELVALYEAHRNCQKLDPKAHAMRVVVKALRDEMDRQRGDDWRWGDTVYFFNEILGDAGEKVADYIRTDNRVVIDPGTAYCAPATDPAPAVCEWAWERPSATSYYGWYRTSHGERTRNFSLGGKCSACGLPIKFTEAKT